MGRDGVVGLGIAAIMATVASVCSPTAAAEQGPTRAAISLYKAGVRNCLYHTDLLVKIAHEDDASYAFVTTVGEPADKAGYTLITVENVAESALTRTFAVTPDASRGCSISTTVVTAVDTSCAVARDELLGEWKFYGDLGNAAAYELESEKESTVVAVPVSSSGCTLIKSTNQSFLGDEQLEQPTI